MAVILLEEAPAVGLVKNKMLYKLQTDQYKTADGVEGIYKIQVDSVPSSGDSFYLRWDEGSVGMQIFATDATTANADSTGTLAGAVGGTKANAANQLYACLLKNILVTSEFDLSRETDGSDEFVVLTALSKGKYTQILDMDSSTWTSLVVDTLGSDDAFNGSFFLVTQLFLYNTTSEKYEYFSQITSKPKQDQSVEIDVAEVLKSAVDDYTLPSIGQTDPILLDSVIRPYKLVICEKDSVGSVTLQPALTIEDKVAWFAGFTEENFSDYPDPMNDWFGNGKRALTWFGSDQEVREDEEHFLTYLNHDATVGSGDTGGGFIPPGP